MCLIMAVAVLLGQPVRGIKLQWRDRNILDDVRKFCTIESMIFNCNFPVVRCTFNIYQKKITGCYAKETHNFGLTHTHTLARYFRRRPQSEITVNLSEIEFEQCLGVICVVNNDEEETWYYYFQFKKKFAFAYMFLLMLIYKFVLNIRCVRSDSYLF